MRWSRCSSSVPMQTINTTGHTGQAARAIARADCLTALPAALWAMANVQAVAVA